MRQFLAIALTIWGVCSATHAAATDPLKYLPVQDAGRVKPYDTFARETLQLVYGSKSFKTDRDERKPATEIILTWMLVPGYWDTQKIVKIDHLGLKETLKLAADQKYFSPAELIGNERFALVVQELNAFRQTKQKLSPYYQSAQRLESQLATYQAVKMGHALRVAPPPPEAAPNTPNPQQRREPDRWQSVGELQGEMQEKFATVVRGFVQALPKETQAQAAPDAAKLGDPVSLETAVASLIEAARKQNPALYPAEKDISIEVHVNQTHPFRIAWILYLVSALFMAIAWRGDRKGMYRAAWAIGVLAFLMHNYGFGLRVYLTGRPPVSNMYESVVWVSWGAMVFALIFEGLYRRYFILLSGAITAVLCLITADAAPTVLDASLQPLEPVLRSNLWLTVHVLTITLSYSAFMLAWGLGNLGLGFILRGDAPGGTRIRELVQSIYRSMQVGVVLLAAGTILGGVWADYSWGRFWGWDPKETWALIALLGYLAVLHGRLVGWVQNFGMMASAVVTFSLVVMAWYGVNYVLGAGMHTYGFGAGGVQYVAGVVALNLLYVGYAAYIYWARAKATVTGS